MAFHAKNKLQGAFVAACKTSTSTELVESWVMRDVPYAFRKSPEEFKSWRDALARCIGVDPAGLVVVGSTAAGLSLSPLKRLRMHSPSSDIDVGVISATAFQEAWDWLVSRRIERLGLQREVLGWIEEHRTRLIFFRQVATDQHLEHLPF